MSSSAQSMARCLMVQGTASSVGKSLLVAALCRILRQDGYRVAPFKAQNMALNSFATLEGGEIGRAQAVQAEAAGIAPSVDMNPILLKPEAEARCQVVVLGRPARVLTAGEYYQQKDELWPVVVAALERLRGNYDVVVIEGAGSPAEVNLKAGDIVNMRVAALARSPVLLVGDIDRGGVFASLVGTLELLEPDERELVRGLVINKFRGDAALLRPGLAFLERRTGKPVLGVIPHLPDLHIADEDSMALDRRSHGRSHHEVDRLDVAVVRLPHISNFDDFDALEREEGVALRYVSNAADLGQPDLIILPGTKATRSDLSWLHARGIADRLLALAKAGAPLLGICGGFQMLGLTIEDSEGVEGPAGTVRALGLLPVATIFGREKATAQVKATVRAGNGLLAGLDGLAIGGYEIHMGRSEPVTVPADHSGYELDGCHSNGCDDSDVVGGEVSVPAQPTGFCRVVERSGCAADDPDGIASRDGWVVGTYLHGLFDNGVLRRRMLANLALRSGRSSIAQSALSPRDSEYDRLAGHVRAHLDVAQVYGWLGL